jgi:CheY-like chemotaxis protein
MAKHILVFDDSEVMLQLFDEILRAEAGYEVTLATFEPDMIGRLKQLEPDLIIADQLHGEEPLGWQLLGILKEDRDTTEIPIILCTDALSELHDWQDFLAASNIIVISKPFNVDDLLSAVRQQLGEAPVPRSSNGYFMVHAPDSYLSPRWNGVINSN